MGWPAAAAADLAALAAAARAAAPYPARVAAVAALFVAAGAALHARRGARPGAARAPAAAAVAAALLAAPALFTAAGGEEIIAYGLTAHFCVWLGTFKALGWAAGRGPLARPGLSAAQFTALLALPLLPARGGKAAPRAAPHAEAAGFAVKAAALGAALRLVSAPGLPVPAQELTYIVIMYLFLGGLMDLAGAAAGALLGLRLAPHFDLPFLACSLADFWGRRWNLATGALLREVVFDPVVEGRLVAAAPGAGARARARASPRRRAAAVCAAFVASGVMHELLLLYILGRRAPLGYWLAFFSLQAPAVLAERAAAGRLAPPPRPLAVAATVGGLLAAGHVLFFPPLVATGLLGDLLRNCRAGYAAAVAALAPPGWRWW